MSKAFKILSLSGGGVRGIFQAAYLKKLSKELDAPIWKYFDLIAGTSTGSIIALALALDVEPERILDLYRNKAGIIFSPKPFYYLRRGPRYDEKNLRDSLLEIFNTKQLRDSKTRVMVTASSLDQFAHKVFSSFSVRGANDRELSAVDVALASSAAPTYFSSVKPAAQERSYVDGGLWANSPSLIAILWAHCYLEQPIENMRLLSINTGDLKPGVIGERYNNMRLFSIETIRTLLEIMFTAQESAMDTIAEDLLGKGNIIRVSSYLPQYIPLDDVNKALHVLPPLAEQRADDNIRNVVAFLKSEIDNSKKRKVTITCNIPEEELLPIDLVKAAGLTAFYPSRKYYNSHRPHASSIDTYVNTSNRNVIIISINLMTGLPFADLCSVLKDKLNTSGDSFSATVSLLNPLRKDLMSSISSIFGYSDDKLSKSIIETIIALKTFKDSLSKDASTRLDLRLHNSIPFGSAIMIDPLEQYGRIQIETKPYKAPLNSSFAFEIARTGVNGLYEALLKGYMDLLKDGNSVEEANL